MTWAWQLAAANGITTRRHKKVRFIIKNTKRLPRDQRHGQSESLETRIEKRVISKFFRVDTTWYGDECLRFFALRLYASVSTSQPDSG